MSKDKLLSDEELEKKVLNLLKIYRRLPTAACERRIISLINTQKRLYAESWKKDAQRWRKRQEETEAELIRAEQRARIK